MMELMSMSDKQQVKIVMTIKNSVTLNQSKSTIKVIVLAQKALHVILEKVTVIVTKIANMA
jgi:hypothetical protein